MRDLWSARFWIAALTLPVLVLAGCGSGSGSGGDANGIGGDASYTTPVVSAPTSSAGGGTVDGWKIESTSSTKGGAYDTTVTYGAQIAHPKALALKIAAKPNLTLTASSVVQCNDGPAIYSAYKVTTPVTQPLKLPAGPHTGCMVNGTAPFSTASTVTLQVLSK